MARRRYKSQLANYSTYQMYLRIMLTIAENVIQIEKLPTFIDKAYMNKKLICDGSIIFFVDEVMGLLAMPYQNVGTLDVYGRPNKVQAIGLNGYISRILNPNEYVLVYDNMGRYPIFADIKQIAERIALARRTCDINIGQQRTPRIWKSPVEKVQSIKDMLNNVDSFEETITTFDGLDINGIESVLSPAPYVTDKVEDYIKALWAEFFQLVGIASLTEQKKERLITDEIPTQLGGTIASRYNRFTPRKLAVDEIREKFGIELEVSFYDGLPTTIRDMFNMEESEAFDYAT